jgi:beta-galactosidase GanA
LTFFRGLCGLVFALCLAMPAAAAELPRIVSKDGRHALLVDGAPFLILGAQANNSTNYPAMLPDVWPTVRAIHANTLEIPVAWEQIEPIEGRFDFSWLDTLIPDARANNVRLVLLWFGTWKNTGPAYTPEWVKSDPKRFPRMMTKDGKTHYVPTPLSRNTLEADKRAFVALMHHLRTIDPQHTVILVQPENEVGSYGLPRDFSPEANRLFAGPIPAELSRKIGKSGTWSQVFDWKADQAFNAWYTARYVDEIAAAGQAELDLPMYVNAVASDPFDEKAGPTGASGGPDWNVLDIWKAAAPHIALSGPDIYDRSHRLYSAKLDRMARPDNPLFVPETGNDLDFARFFWLALGKGAIGWSPFGMDPTYANFPLGAKELGPEIIEAFASKFALMAPVARDWARLAFEHPTIGFAKGDDASDQSATLGQWKITAQYGMWEFGDRTSTTVPHPNKERPVGGAALIQLGPDEFLLAGSEVRMSFALADPRPGESTQYLSVEEGTFVDGRWMMKRRWNGDQTDYGLNLKKPTLLKVRLGR